MVDLDRRRLAGWLAGVPIVVMTMEATGCSPQLRVYDMKVTRDVGCLCCHAWTDLMKKSGRFQITLTEAEDLPVLKHQLGVPAGLGACHTAEVDGYVVEGHVPLEDVLRLLEERPKGVRGIAVAGMPRGSPGMEQPNGAIDGFDVVAFGIDGSESVFSRRAGNT